MDTTKNSSINTIAAFSFIFFIFFTLSYCSNDSVIGDEGILEELNSISVLALMDENNVVHLKASDLDDLNRSVAKDPIASHYVEELYYMIAHNGSDHIAHNIDFLDQYLTTGEKYACAPHELWHATLYIENGDLELVDHAVTDAASALPFWVSESRDKQKKFPQFYLRLDEQITEAEYLIEQLYQKNYSEELVKRLNYLGETASC